MAQWPRGGRGRGTVGSRLLLGGPAILVRDSFNRPDSATTLGSADSGQAWTPAVGTWGISSDQAYLASATAQAVAVIDAGRANLKLTCTATPSPTASRGDLGVVIRYIDSNNYLLVAFHAIGSTAPIQLYKRDAGAFVSLAALAAPDLTNGVPYGVTITAWGPSIAISLSNGYTLSYTLLGADATKYGTPTLVGLRVNDGVGVDDGGSRFDNLKVVGA